MSWKPKMVITSLTITCVKLCQMNGNLWYSDWVYHLCLLCITWTSVMQVCCLLHPRSLFIITTRIIISCSCLVTWNLSLIFPQPTTKVSGMKCLRFKITQLTINMRNWLSVCHHKLSHKCLFIRGLLINRNY